MKLIRASSSPPTSDVQQIAPTDNLVRGGAVVLGMRLLISGLVFVLQLVIARVLGLSEFGTYAFAMAWVQTLVVIGKFGVDNASLRHIAAHHACGEKSLLSGFLTWSESLTFRVSLVIGIGLALLMPLFVPVERETLRICFWMGSLFVLVRVSQATRLYQLRAVGHILQSLLAVALWPAIAAGLASIVYVLSDAPVLSPLIFATQIVAIGVSWGVATWLRSWSPLAAASGVTGDTRKAEWLRTSVTFLGVAIVVHLQERMGILLAGLLIDTDAAGIFALSERFAGVALLGVESLVLLTAPKFAALSARGRTDDVLSLFRRSRYIGLAFSIPVAGIMWGASHILLDLIDPRFQAGRPILFVLLLGTIAQASAGSVACALSMCGREAITLLGALLGVGVNLALSLVLIPWLGLMGLAVAQLVTNIVWAIYMTSQLELDLSHPNRRP